MVLLKWHDARSALSHSSERLQALPRLSKSNNQMPKFVSLGMFIVDEFHYLDENGNPTGRTQDDQVRISRI